MSDSPSSATAVLPEATPCPVCGYDLRATTGGICPECGSAVHRDDLSRSKLPWRYRRELGRSRAVWRMLRLTLRRPWALVGELTTQPAKRDAEIYAWPFRVVSLLASAALARTLVNPNWAANLIYPKAAPPNLPLVNDVLAPMWTAVSTLDSWPLMATAMLLTWLVPMSVRAAFAGIAEEHRPEMARAGSILTRYLAANLAISLLGVWACALLLWASGWKDPYFVRLNGVSLCFVGVSILAGGVGWVVFGSGVTIANLLRRCSRTEPLRLVWGLARWAMALALCVATAVMLGWWLPGLLAIYGLVALS